MRGTRVKRLRKKFIMENRRFPFKAKMANGRVIRNNEFRPIKKAYKG